jgi:hypothetical protein
MIPLKMKRMKNMITDKSKAGTKKRKMMPITKLTIAAKNAQVPGITSSP